MLTFANGRLEEFMTKPVTVPGRDGVFVIGSGVFVGVIVGVEVGIFVGSDEGVIVEPNACPGRQPKTDKRMIKLEMIRMLRFMSTPKIQSKSKVIRRHEPCDGTFLSLKNYNCNDHPKYAVYKKWSFSSYIQPWMYFRCEAGVFWFFGHWWGSDTRLDNFLSALSTAFNSCMVVWIRNSHCSCPRIYVDYSRGHSEAA